MDDTRRNETIRESTYSYGYISFVPFEEISSAGPRISVAAPTLGTVSLRKSHPKKVAAAAVIQIDVVTWRQWQDIQGLEALDSIVVVVRC